MPAGHTTEIQFQGRVVTVPCASVNGYTVITTGKMLRIASIVNQHLLEGEIVPDPEVFASQIQQSALKADIFTFAQKIPDDTPKYLFHMEWDNASVIPITSYSEWFTNMVQSDVRKAIRKSLKRGVTVEEVRFDDNFVKGIQNIYNETTLRQGKPFWHYGKDLDTVRRDNSTYFDRSCYIGAYYEDELIGFIRMIVVDRVATTLQVIAQQKYFGKKPTNALIAKAVEVCEKRELSHLVYGSYVYTDPHSSLTEFKRRNGFQQMLIPRYCIPLTRSGAVSLSFGLHRPASRWMPYPIIRRLRDLRDRWNYRRLKANPKS